MRRKVRPAFGSMLYERRRRMQLTQRELARRIGTSTPYIGHLEAGKRHPSDGVLVRLAAALDLDSRELFTLANPRAMKILEPVQRQPSAWDEFRANKRLQRLHRINPAELELLERIAGMGPVGRVRDVIYIIETIRYALGS